MSGLSDQARKHLRISMGDRGTGKEIADAIDRSTSDPFGVQRLGAIFAVDLADLGAKYVALLTLPTGYILRYVGIRVLEDIVAGGTTVKLAVGVHDGDVDAYGKTSALTVDAGFSKLFNGTVLGSDLTLDLCGVLTDGSGLGDSNITAGKVFVSIVWDQPA